MTYPTHSLELLILLAGVFPSGLSYSLSYVLGGKNAEASTSLKFLGLLSLPFLLLVPTVARYRPQVLHLQWPSARWLVLGVLSIGAVFVIEYATAFLYHLVQERRLPRGLGLHQFWSGSLRPAQHALLVLVAVGEEFVFRNIGFDVLRAGFGATVWSTLFITSAMYAVNHTFFGWASVGAKFASGLLYGALYLYSGSLLVPVLAHVGYNYALLAGKGRKPTEVLA